MASTRSSAATITASAHDTAQQRTEKRAPIAHRTAQAAHEVLGSPVASMRPVLLGVQTSSRSRSPRIARLSVTCEKRQLAESMRRARDMRKQERYKDEMARLRANGAKIEIEIEIEILGRSIE